MTHDLGSLVEVVGFLVAMTVLGRACADEGLFDAWGGAVARVSRDPRRLGVAAGLLAAGTTVVLTLDATVVLLTPVLLAAGLGRRGSLLSVRLANSASTLLPISNLTNLLAVAATGWTFLEFARVMLPVWVVAVVAEIAIVTWWCRRDPAPAPPSGPVPATPLVPAGVVIAVLCGLAAGEKPWIVATAGAVLMAAHAVAIRATTWRDLLAAANLPLAVVVVVWGWVVTLVAGTPAGDWITDLLPHGTTWAALVGIALISMVTANVINNLPATLLLLPAAAATGPIGVAALLVGVNVGANLTAVGSLANLLWRGAGGRATVRWAEFHRLGLLTTPLLVVLGASVLWAWSFVAV
ncbi:MAG: arsenic transporter [Aeromicrobium sp.]|uniref:SLC13 family permease n=1 Tax=Aeromicrobium sp. TaxID=1871063 RepID=UPI00262825BA|nr:SLC13 family permease [Aeromicrobium sp.]MDF1703582.1 arsenic transporter [Aeromicrobium sp.]